MDMQPGWLPTVLIALLLGAFLLAVSVSTSTESERGVATPAAMS